MICFAVGFSRDGVGVGCQVVKFRGSVVCALGHDVLLVFQCKPSGKVAGKLLMSAESARTPSSPHFRNDYRA
jgi:hypothetical protein